MAGSIGVFALAVFQAQVGCSGYDAAPAPPTSESGHEAGSVDANPPSLNAAAADATSVQTDADAAAPEAQTEPENEPETARAPARSAAKAAGVPGTGNEDAKAPVFMGASKSGIVMERPPPRPAPNASPRQAAQQQPGPQA